MGIAKVIHFTDAAPVFLALRARAQADNVPTDRFRKACQLALRVLDEGRSGALAVSEGVKAMRPVHAVRVPDGAA